MPDSYHHCAAGVQFSLQSYWDNRYTQDQLTFEWYRDYNSLAPVLTRWGPSIPASRWKRWHTCHACM
jgi:hypothetical protein